MAHARAYGKGGATGEGVPVAPRVQPRGDQQFAWRKHFADQRHAAIQRPRNEVRNLRKSTRPWHLVQLLPIFTVAGIRNRAVARADVRPLQFRKRDVVRRHLLDEAGHDLGLLGSQVSQCDADGLAEIVDLPVHVRPPATRRGRGTARCDCCDGPRSARCRKPPGAAVPGPVRRSEVDRLLGDLVAQVGVDPDLRDPDPADDLDRSPDRGIGDVLRACGASCPRAGARQRARSAAPWGWWWWWSSSAAAGRFPMRAPAAVRGGVEVPRRRIGPCRRHDQEHDHRGQYARRPPRGGGAGHVGPRYRCSGSSSP